MSVNNQYPIDLDFIARAAATNSEGNDRFCRFLHNEDNAGLDLLAHEVYEKVHAAIDCRQCGNCCRSLVINVAPGEVSTLAAHLQLPESATIEKYIEVSQQGHHYINAIPCHFLHDSKCTIYPARFRECRDFPHLHKPGFKDRLSGTLMHYGRCPIIYYVLEEMKVATGFTSLPSR